MKIDFSTELKSLTGEPLPESGEPNAKSATVAKICTDALMLPTKDDEGLTGEEKLKRFELATRIVKGGKIEISVEEAAMLKALVGKGYAPLVVGQVWPLLDGK